jgi:purine-binding chemotaxis protein CheW
MENFSGAAPYLSFWLDNELYAFDINNVVEVMELPKITTVPQCAVCIKGVFNFRGEILPAIDVMAKCNLVCTHETSDDDKAIIVLDINKDDPDSHLTAGAIVEKVSDVINIKPIDIIPIHDFDTKIDAAFAEGIYNHDGKIITILNTAKILALNNKTIIS